MATYTEIKPLDAATHQAQIDVLFVQSADDDLTEGIDLRDYKLKALIMPGTWTAADISFEVSIDDITYNPLTNVNGVTYTVTVVADKYVMLPISDTFSWTRFIKLASSVGQAADRTIILVLER